MTTPTSELTVIQFLKEMLDSPREMAMVMLMPMALVMVTGSHASQCVCERIPISVWLDKLSAGGAMPAHKKTFHFLIFRLVTGSQAFHIVRKRIQISAYVYTKLKLAIAPRSLTHHSNQVPTRQTNYWNGLAATNSMSDFANASRVFEHA